MECCLFKLFTVSQNVGRQPIYELVWCFVFMDITT